MKTAGAAMRYASPLALLFLILIAIAAGQGHRRQAPNTVVMQQTSSTPQPQDEASPQARVQLPVPASEQRVKNTIGLNSSGRETSSQMYYLTLYNVRSVLVSDTLGNSVDPMFENPTGGIIEGITYDYPNRESVMLTTPIDKTYTVQFQSRGTEEIRINIVKGFNNSSPNQAVRYNNLFLPTGVTAMLKLTPTAVATLRLDNDRDGVFETNVLPTVSLNGSAAADTQGPHISFSETTTGNTSIIKITATDPSGLRTLYYSLDTYAEDGMTFHPYTAPIEVKDARMHVIYAVAEDQSGNSSGLASYTLKVASRE